MQITKEQAMAYTEVIEVLKYMSNEDISKIPEDILTYYKNNMDKEYEFSIDINKDFEHQDISEKAKVVLAILYRDYWATQEQREKIKRKEQYDLEQIELQKKEKYNPDNIFKDKNKPVEETKALVEYKKETWYTRFIDFMKKIFKGNK